MKSHLPLVPLFTDIPVAIGYEREILRFSITLFEKCFLF
jgi:hypothetical protein